MLAWMIYAVLVAIALSAAALLAERGLKYRKRATRWPWLVAIVASLLLPIAMATVSIPLPASAGPTATVAPKALREMTSVPLASAVIDWSGATSYSASPRIDLIAKDIWLASSFTLMMFLGISTALFHRRKRDWPTDLMCGSPVLVSDSAGPAVVGLIRSRIVVPAWLMEETPAQQRYVMAHEQSHLTARDPLLVAIALMLLATMPWNPLLWWQFHRLRCAIEVDCDARVLRSGGDVGEYCETLIQVGQNQSGYVGAVTAMSESRSFLEQRIKIMLSKPQKWAGVSAFALISVALGMAVFAAQVTPPTATPAAPAAAVTMNPSLLDAYTGFYELSDYSMVTVARKGNGLTVTPIGQFLAQGTIDVTAVNDTTVLIPSIDITLEFTKGAAPQATGIVVREHGNVVLRAPRVDQATAERIRDGLAARVKNQQPYPNSEKALKLVLNNSTSGEGMTPQTAENFARGHDAMANTLASLGPVQSYKFEGVTDYGLDIYDVQYPHTALQVFIQVNRDGALANTVMRRQ